VKSFAASTIFFLAAAPFLAFGAMQRTEEEWSVRVWTLLAKKRNKRLHPHIEQNMIDTRCALP
jgi:hypothetical protein